MDNRIFSNIKDYCDLTTIENRRRYAEFKYSTNSEDEEQRYRCLGLAALFNYFVITDSGVKIRNGMTNELSLFLHDKEQYSTEHFIINSSGGCVIKISGMNEYKYEYDSDTLKYKSSLFNYIFIPKSINNTLGNDLVRSKLSKIDISRIKCEYSKTVLSILNKSTLFSLDINEADEIAIKDTLDRYFSYDFKRHYSSFVSEILKIVTKKLTGN